MGKRLDIKSLHKEGIRSMDISENSGFGAIRTYI